MGWWTLYSIIVEIVPGSIPTHDSRPSGLASRARRSASRRGATSRTANCGTARTACRRPRPRATTRRANCLTARTACRRPRATSRRWTVMRHDVCTWIRDVAMSRDNPAFRVRRRRPAVAVGVVSVFLVHLNWRNHSIDFKYCSSDTSTSSIRGLVPLVPIVGRIQRGERRRRGRRSRPQ